MATPRPMALMEAQIPGSPELCERVVQAAEAAGFEYLLIPVGSVCWEAWITGAFMAARSKKIKPLIAARPGYINPVLMAKMISTFDQMSGGRICINLIAGQNESEVEGRRRALCQGGALRADGGGGLDPQSAVDHARPGAFRRQVPQADHGAQIRPRPLQRRIRNSISAAARARPGRCRRNIPTCICSGATCRRGSPQTSPRSGSWRARTAASTRSVSACGCR